MPDPIQSKIVAVTTSSSVDKAICRILNRSTGDMWTGIIATDTVLIDLANNNIWGDGPTQWVNGDILEIVVFAENYGVGVHTLVDGLNEPTITIGTDTAVTMIF